MSAPTEMPLSTREKAFGIVFAMVASALLLEMGFHILGPEYSGFNNMLAEYPDNPRGYFDSLDTESGHTVYGIRMNAANGLGGRKADASTPRSSGAARILGLGDSQSQGQGVRFSDTMYEQLSARLAEQGIEAKAKNVSVSGYDLDEITARYAYETADGDRYPLVLYAMVLDDFGLDRSEITGLDFIQYQPGYTADPWRMRSATWNFFAHIAEQWTLSQRTTQAYLTSFEGENLTARMDQLARLSQQVESDGGILVVAVLPLLYDFDSYPFADIHGILRTQAAERDIALIDLLAVLRSEQASSLWVHATDHHPNEIAHRMVADALFAFLDERKFTTGLKAP